MSVSTFRIWTLDDDDDTSYGVSGRYVPADVVTVDGFGDSHAAAARLYAERTGYTGFLLTRTLDEDATLVRHRVERSAVTTTREG